VKETVAEYSSILGEAIDEIKGTVIGKEKELEIMFSALVAGGHVIIEGPPGSGKTFSCKSIAKAFGGSYKRIQGNPDVLPSDIVGFYVYTLSGSRQYVKGPVFTNILQVDDINMIPPRALSALLQAMTEYSVSVEGDTYTIQKPFHVFATMIPQELEAGAYKLPIGLLDRFWVSITMDYTGEELEREIVGRADELYESSTESIKTLLSPGELSEIREELKNLVYMDSRVLNYMLNIVNKLRNSEDVLVGPSNRGAIQYYRLSKAYALIKGRDYVIPDDVKHLSSYVLPHRIITRPTATRTPKEIVEEVVESTPVPKE
jgi:MoxR-like ATPase